MRFRLDQSVAQQVRGWFLLPAGTQPAMQEVSPLIISRLDIARSGTNVRPVCCFSLHQPFVSAQRSAAHSQPSSLLEASLPPEHR
jgi:hypothetical protein